MLLSILGFLLTTVFFGNKVRVRAFGGVNHAQRTQPIPGSAVAAFAQTDYDELNGHLLSLLKKVFENGAKGVELTAYCKAAGEAELRVSSYPMKPNRDGAEITQVVEIVVGGDCMKLEIAEAVLQEFEAAVGRKWDAPVELASLFMVDFYYESEWVLRSLVARRKDGSTEIAKTLQCANPAFAGALLCGMRGRLA